MIQQFSSQDSEARDVPNGQTKIDADTSSYVSRVHFVLLTVCEIVLFAVGIGIRPTSSPYWSLEPTVISILFGVAFSAPASIGILYFLDLKTRRYSLVGKRLLFSHPAFPLLNRSYDLENFTHYRIEQEKGWKALHLYKKGGLAVSIPIIGTVPRLVSAIIAAHPMVPE